MENSINHLQTAQLNAFHDARHPISHQDSEQIAALNWLSHGHAHRICNLQNRVLLFYAAQLIKAFYSELGASEERGYLTCNWLQLKYVKLEIALQLFISTLYYIHWIENVQENPIGLRKTVIKYIYRKFSCLLKFKINHRAFFVPWIGAHVTKDEETAKVLK